MATELIVNASLPETRVTLMEDGEIQELLIERATGKGIVGNIYKGRVTRVLPGMQAAFVDIGLEKAAFLYVDDVYVHSHIWQAEEGEDDTAELGAVTAAVQEAGGEEVATADAGPEETSSGDEAALADAGSDITDEAALEQMEDEDLNDDEDDEIVAELDDEGSEEDDEPVSMGAEGEDDGDDNIGNRAPQGTIAPVATPTEGGSEEAPRGRGGRFNNRRGKRGGRGGRNQNQRRGPKDPNQTQIVAAPGATPAEGYPESYYEQVSEAGDVESDRASVTPDVAGGEVVGERPEASATEGAPAPRIVIGGGENQGGRRPEFREQRSRDRRIRPKQGMRQSRAAVNIQDLLKEGQEVIVQVAKDPIATKGARLTCHISLPGRHLVCMPTIDHVGVSRRIERDEERRRLREYVDRNRPKNLGFIVRTATSSGKMQAEKRIKQDIDYLSALWNEIKDKANNVSSPALVYEDLNPVLRAIRDWVNEEIDKIVVDSRYHYNEITRFVSNFMPSVRQKVELYQGDIPIFDAYNISTELSRALERKVWLKSGGYIVVDQAEALVAIDVNTGRYVGKKSLEDTILKTNLEAVKEIAYQLRLRNCGGIIILDLIDMEKDENKFRVYRALEDELKKDRARPQILKISELGLIEMTRKRTRDTIVRALCDSCSHCEGKGFIKSKQTVAYEILRNLEREGIDRETTKILVQSHPDVIDVLAIDERETLDQIERRFRKTVFLQAVPDFHPEQFEVTTEKNNRSEKSDDQILERARESAQTTSDPRRDRNKGGGRHDRGGRRDRYSNKDRNNQQSGSGGGSGITIRPVTSTGITPVGQIVQNPQNTNDQAPVITPQADVSVDDENFGNQNFNSSDSSQGQVQQITANGNHAPVQSSDDDFFSEEDRIAFLRAQAAQDAAIAKLGNGGVGASPNGNTAGGGRNNGGQQNNGGRWGKNWRNRNNNNNRGGRGGRNGGGRFQGGYRANNAGRGLPQGGGPGIQPVIQPAVSTAPSPVVHDGGGSDDSSSNE